MQFLNCKKDEDTTVSFNATVANSSEGTVDFTSGDYDIGSSITITATPKTGYVFSNWTNTSTNQTYTTNPLSITINENTNLVANFEKAAYNVMFTISGQGSVQKEDVDGGEFTHGSQVKLTAIPSEDYSFFYWNNDPGDTENPKTITLDGDQNIPTKFDYQVAKDLIGNWEFEISDPASKNVTIIKMSIDIFLNVLISTIVNGEVISKVFTQMEAISSSAIVIGDFAVITNVVVASATSLRMNIVSIPDDTVPPTKETDSPEIFYWLLYLDTSKELNLSGNKSDEEPEKDQEGIIIPPTDAVTASTTTLDIGAIFNESFDKLLEVKSSNFSSDTVDTSTSSNIADSDASCSLEATLLETVSSDNQTVASGSSIEEINYYIITECTRVIHLVSSTGLPSGVSASIIGDVLKISGTPTGETSGTFNYSVVIDNHLEQTSSSPFVSATVSKVLNGTISVINAGTSNLATTTNTTDSITSSQDAGTTSSTAPVGGDNSGTTSSSGGGDTNTGIASSTTSLDTTPPVISITGSTSITITEGDTYTDAGASATDDVSGDLTSSIVTTNPVDTSTPGTYTVTYTVSDVAGNTTSIGRLVTVLVPPSPETYTINVTASNSSDYSLSGVDRNGNVTGNDPSVTVNVGDSIDFVVDASGHPFYLKTVQGTGSSDLIGEVTNNGATNGTVSWTPTASGTYYYQCSLHNGMNGTITVN